MAYGTCARCGQKGELLARHLHEGCYHKALHDETLKNYSGEMTEPVPTVRESWQYEGRESELIAEREAEDLRARVTQQVFAALERQANPYGIAASAPAGKLSRLVDIGAIQFVVYGADDREMDAAEAKLRAAHKDLGADDV